MASGILRKVERDTVSVLSVERDYRGAVDVTTTSTITGFWIDKMELFIDNDGHEQRSSSVLYTLTPLPLDTWVVKGTVTGSPRDIHEAGAIRVKAVNDAYSLSSNRRLCKHWLGRE